MMSKDVINAANVSLDVCSIIICLIIAFSISYFKKKDESAKWFLFTNIAAIFYGITDIFMWISEGTDAAWKLVALPLSSFLYYFTGIFIIYFYIGYVIRYYQKDTKINKGYSYFSLGISILYMILLILTPFLGLYYTIAPDNTYHRGSWFMILVGIEVVLYLEALLLILKYHKNVQNLENIGFASFIFFPFISHIIQIANFGVALISIGLAISFLIIFINLNQKMHQELEISNKLYNEKRIQTLERQKNSVYYFTNLIENRKLESGVHEIRVTNMVRVFADACARKGIYRDVLSEQYIEQLVDAIPFHDIGKIYIPDYILNKPGKLTEEEFITIQTHAENGAKIVSDILPLTNNRDQVRLTAQICRSHHERWNGKGYPEHLREKDIPLGARIMAIVDVFEALVNYRCYKNPSSYDEAFDIIKKGAGVEFDPVLVEEFLAIKDKIIEENEKYKDNSIEGL